MNIQLTIQLSIQCTGSRLEARSSARDDFGYGEVALPFVARIADGRHLDVYMLDHEARLEELRRRVAIQSRGLWTPPDSDLVAGRYRYLRGRESASDAALE